MDRRKAVIVTNDRFPDLDAGAIRLYAFIKILNKLGYDVSAYSLGKEIVKNEHYVMIPLGSKKESLISRIFARVFFFSHIKGLLKNEHFDVCVYTQVDKITQKFLVRQSKKNKATLIFDCVEWFSPDEFFLKKLSFTYRLNQKYNKKIIDKNNVVISISKYLERHFISRNIKTIYIPAIGDGEDYGQFEKNNQLNSKMVFLYAGSPGKKDQLALIVEAFFIINSSFDNKYKLIIAGCSKDQFVSLNSKCVKHLNAIEKNVEFLGRCSHTSVKKLYQNADFSILMRDSTKTFAKAGFPTKFIESMMLSTPVICNLSSDLGDYLVNEKNGLLVKKDDSLELSYTIQKALSLTKEQIYNMSLYARETALSFFDYNKYIDIMASILPYDYNNFRRFRS